MGLLRKPVRRGDSKASGGAKAGHVAIFSINHGSVGRSTHQAGTAAAHAKYILRGSAVSMVMGENMPTERNEAAKWLNDQEQAERKNGRMIDKIRLALPIELTPEQRAELVRKFAQQFTIGRASWVAGIHDRGEDAGNPHAHLLIRDKDFETGKRVAALSEKGSTERIREAWELAANQALERAGHTQRIDRRSLKDQGIDREAGIHVGPVAQAMQQKGTAPVSHPQEVKQRDGQTRIIDWPEIDQGRSRADRQAEIKARNRGADMEQKLEIVLVRKTPEGNDREHDRAIEVPAPSREQPKVIEAVARTPRKRKAEPAARPAPRLFGRMYSVAATITQRIVECAAAVFERSPKVSAPKPVNVIQVFDRRDERTPQQITLDAIRATQARERQERPKVSYQELKAMLERDPSRGHDGPER